LQEELAQWKQLPVTQHTIESLKEVIEQQSEELKDLSEKYLNLSSQFNSNVDLQSEFDRQK
jgi:hypothetical protein